MFGSQALETAIGLVLMFFVLATVSSVLVEILGRLLGKRARDLEDTIGALLAGKEVKDADLRVLIKDFKETRVYQAARAGTGRTLFRRRRRDPSYLSAKAYGEAVCEMVVDGQSLKSWNSLPDGVRGALEPLAREVGADLTKIRARLESRFDEAMQRAEGAYKRWATLCLFVAGLLVAAGMNASTFEVASDLWRDPVTRQVVVDSAQQLGPSGGTATDQLDSVADATEALTQLGLPVGWTDEDRSAWSDADWLQMGAMMLGWLVTALLVMLGAPFWFDLLGKLVALRNTGAKPLTASQDPDSATAVVAAGQSAAHAAEVTVQTRGGLFARVGTNDKQAQPVRADVPALVAKALGVAPSKPS